MPETNSDVISQNLNERNIIIYLQHGDDIPKVREHDALLQSSSVTNELLNIKINLLGILLEI